MNVYYGAKIVATIPICADYEREEIISQVQKHLEVPRECIRIHTMKIPRYLGNGERIIETYHDMRLRARNAESRKIIVLLNQKSLEARDYTKFIVTIPTFLSTLVL